VGFSCECDEKYFVSQLNGSACATSGVEVQFKMGGMVLASDTSLPANIEMNRQNMVEARLIFITELFRQQYLNAQSSAELLIEGVNRYPIDMVSESIQDPSSPLYMRSLWRIVLRAPDKHLNLAKMAQGAIFDDTETWARLFNDSSKFMVSRAVGFPFLPRQTDEYPRVLHHAFAPKVYGLVYMTQMNTHGYYITHLNPKSTEWCT